MTTLAHPPEAATLPATPPTGLPDVATLARLATAFFNTPPAPYTPGGGVALPANPQPAGFTPPPGSTGPSTPAAVPFGVTPPGANLLPQSPQTAANYGASAPSLLPHAPAGNGAPDALFTAAPGYDGRAGSHVLAVPQSPAPTTASVPATGAVPANQTPTGAYALPWLAAPSRPLEPELDLSQLATQPFLPATPVPAASAAPADEASLPWLGVPQSGGATPASHASHYYFVQPVLQPARPQPAAVPRLSAASAHAPFDVNVVRRDFPILQERVGGKPIVWFDNAATTQKPQVVIDRLAHFYAHENSNIHRAAHELAARATDAYEGARETVRRFIGAAQVEEIVFVRGTTEAINLVAKSWGVHNVGAGDEIIVSHLEHHANIVPWQQLAAEKGARLRVIPVDDNGQILLDEYRKLLGRKTRLVAITQVANALGTVTPVQEITALAHAAGARVLVDGAQSVAHMPTDVQALDADFFVFSGHKIFGPTGIGALYGKRELLEAMPPWQGGGNMIADVTFERTLYHGAPARFEAGTGNIADAAGLAAALEYVERIGAAVIGQYEHALLEYAIEHMQAMPGLRLIGTAAHKASVLSFVLDGYTTQQVGEALNREGIAVRTGHHCAQPILRRFGLEATVRPSLAFYNTCEEVDRMVDAIQQLVVARKR